MTQGAVAAERATRRPKPREDQRGKAVMSNRYRVVTRKQRDAIRREMGYSPPMPKRLSGGGS